MFFATLAFAFLEPYFFIGYLISIALFGLFQAIFMANAGGAWDNAKKIVEVELKEKGTPLHAATVVGDTVGDPFKDTSSVAMNPVIKFTTLFGLLAVELARQLDRASTGAGLSSRAVGGVLRWCRSFFVWRSFYGMRIRRRARLKRWQRARVRGAGIDGPFAGRSVSKRVARAFVDTCFSALTIIPALVSRRLPVGRLARAQARR